MKWEFWKKERGVEAMLAGSSPGPLPPSLSAHLVDELKLGCDWVRSLECVTKNIPGQRHLVAFRIYSPSQAKRMGIVVNDHGALDGFSYLVLFSGTINTKTGKIDLMPVRACPNNTQPTAG